MASFLFLKQPILLVNLSIFEAMKNSLHCNSKISTIAKLKLTDKAIPISATLVTALANITIATTKFNWRVFSFSH